MSEDLAAEGLKGEIYIVNGIDVDNDQAVGLGCQFVLSMLEGMI